MRLRIIWKMLMSGQMRIVRELSRSSQELYRTCFLARASDLGLLKLLAPGEATLTDIARDLGIESGHVQALEALLDLGVSIGELRAAGGRYRLKGFLSTTLSRQENDPWRALVSEMVDLYIPYIAAAPGQEADARRLAELTVSLSPVIARSSRTIEPVLRTVTRELVPARGPLNLLEVGCGSGVYVLAALERNPLLTATAIEREPDVARAAQEAIAKAGCADRCRMVNADMRTLSFGQEFDLITLHNNIYYFPEQERPALLALLHSWLRPGGRLAVTTTCRGGGPFSHILMLWSVLTAGAGRLPDPGDFAQLMRQAGFPGATAHCLIPGEAYTLFVGRKQQ